MNAALRVALDIAVFFGRRGRAGVLVRAAGGPVSAPPSAPAALITGNASQARTRARVIRRHRPADGCQGVCDIDIDGKMQCFPISQVGCPTSTAGSVATTRFARGRAWRRSA
jgi:hypothetical protein